MENKKVSNFQFCLGTVLLCLACFMIGQFYEKNIRAQNVPQAITINNYPVCTEVE